MSKGYLNVTVSRQAGTRKLVHELTGQRRHPRHRTVTKMPSYLRNSVRGQLTTFLEGGLRSTYVMGTAVVFLWQTEQAVYKL